MMRPYLDAPEILAHGEWRTNGAVQVWVPSDEPHPSCGTDSGYYRHRRTLRENACGECLTAHRVAERDRNSRRREKRQ